jgi:adenylate kinase
MKAVILLGAPGAGKGTVADGIKKATDYVHVSTGDVLRDALKAGTEVGLSAKKYMDAGELVPDEVVVRIVEELLSGADPEGHYLFDGFPRTLSQARLFDEVLEARGAELVRVYLLEIPKQVVVERMAGRRICRDCGAVYHVVNIPPRTEGVCDSCGGALYQRDDDNEETVLNRLEVFTEQTAGLIDRYETRGVLKRIDAAGSKDVSVGAVLADLQASASCDDS